MRLHCVRHMPVIQHGVCYGRNDVEVQPLTRQSAITQCVTRCDAIYASPSARCLTMAKAYAAGRLVVVDARLMEMSFGDWEGLSWANINRAAIDAWASNVRFFSTPNGESFDGLINRVEQWLTEIRRSPVSELMVFTHAGVIKSLHVLLLGQSSEQAAAFCVPHHQPVSFTLPS